MQNISPLSLTPPRTPELKASDSCSNSDVDMYRSNFLTVPGQQIASGDSCYSLYDLDQVKLKLLFTSQKVAQLDDTTTQLSLSLLCNRQDSNMGKSASEVIFTLCFDDANRDEIERLHHMINEMESENGCNRLIITKLEDELLMIRKCESRAVSHLMSPFWGIFWLWRILTADVIWFH